MANLHIVKHPLIEHKITLLKNKNTGAKEFRELVSELASLLAYEASRDLELSEIEIETPLEITKSKIVEKKIAIVPILRAGIGMCDGVLNMLPTAKVGHIGLYRDPKTLKAIEYYCKLPSDIANRKVFVLDPMLATGGTAVTAIDFLKSKNVKDMSFLSIISCPQGIENFHKHHPDIDVYTAAHDRELNQNAYILPGLGDAGDRIFGTK